MSGFCKCPTPKPRPAGVGKVVCVTCHGKVFAKKKGESDEKFATIPPDQMAKMIRDFERDLRQMQLRLQQLKQASQEV